MIPCEDSHWHVGEGVNDDDAPTDNSVMKSFVMLARCWNNPLAINPLGYLKEQLELLMNEGSWMSLLWKVKLQENQTSNVSWFLDSYILSYCMYMCVPDLPILSKKGKSR